MATPTDPAARPTATAQIQQRSEGPVTGALTPSEARCAALLGNVVLLRCSEPLHQVPPAVVALIGAVVAASPAPTWSSPPREPCA